MRDAQTGMGVHPAVQRPAASQSHSSPARLHEGQICRRCLCPKLCRCDAANSRHENHVATKCRYRWSANTVTDHEHFHGTPTVFQFKR